MPLVVLYNVQAYIRMLFRVTCLIEYFIIIYWRLSIFIFVLCSVYLVEYTLNPNSMKVIVLVLC